MANPTYPTTDLSPWPAGQTTPITMTLAYGDGGVPALAGATFTLIIHNLMTNVDLIGAGSFVGLDPTAGVITYLWSPSDPVAAPGYYTLLVKVTLADGTLRFFGPESWTVVAV